MAGLIQTMNKEITSPQYDKAGIASALLCTIHCLVVPVLFILKSYWTGHSTLQLPWWYEKIDYLFLVISFIAVYHSAGHTPLKAFKISLWFFWLALAIALMAHESLHWLAYIASTGLIATHFVNLRRLTRTPKLQGQ